VVPQEALESEQHDALGRERYQRPAGRGYRNGYRPGYVEGAGRRTLRALEEPFQQALEADMSNAPISRIGG